MTAGEPQPARAPGDAPGDAWEDAPENQRAAALRAPIVELSGLSKSFGSFAAVSDLSLTVAPGEIFALLGPNGAGKTTTIRMLMGILQPSSGSARIAGLDCFAQRASVMRHVGYLPDEPAFYDYLRGSELLRFTADMHSLDAATYRERAARLTALFGLDEALEEFAINYSKGMRKKLALVCALLHAPRLLILDEPTNGLDPFSTRTLLGLLRELTSAGTAVFFSTHLLDQAERLCERVAIVHQGRLAACGALQELRDTLVPGGSLEDVFFEVAGEPRRDEPGSDGPGSDEPVGDEPVGDEPGSGELA